MVSIRRVGKFEHVSEEYRKNKDYKPNLPTRGTVGSAGYDFECPVDITINPGEHVFIWSDIKLFLEEGYCLKLHPRSSVGLKKIMLTLSTAIIDTDYYFELKTGGNIGIPLYNYGNDPIHFNKGDRVVQGIIESYYITDEDKVTVKRNGGLGSTGK